MEPLPAISLASNVIQIVDFGIGLARDAIATYKSASGTIVANEATKFTALDLNYVLSRVATSIQPQGAPFVLLEHDQRRENLRQRCEGLAQELLTTLKKFRCEKGDGRRKSMVKALRGSLSDAEIKSIDERLPDMRQELGLYVVVDPKYVTLVFSPSTMFSSRAGYRNTFELHSVEPLAAFEALYAQTKAIMDTFLANRKDVAAIMEARHEEMKAL
jgi:hypothetical protein